MKKLSKELIGASTIPIILSLLSKSESYGYEIIQNIKDISNGDIQFEDGTLYPVLHKLEKKKLIDSFWKVADNGRKRKYYRINKTGELQIKAEKDNWKIINEILYKLWNIEPNLI